MTEAAEFATKVVKDSIKEIKVAMPKELSRSIRFTVSVHVYSWVIRKEKAEELIVWLGEHGFKNIQTDAPVVEEEGVEANTSTGVFTTVTATATGDENEPNLLSCPGSCSLNQTQDTCNGIGTYDGNVYYCYWNVNECTQKNKVGPCCSSQTCNNFSQSDCSSQTGTYVIGGTGIYYAIPCEWAYGSCKAYYIYGEKYPKCVNNGY